MTNDPKLVWPNEHIVYEMERGFCKFWQLLKILQYLVENTLVFVLSEFLIELFRLGVQTAERIYKVSIKAMSKLCMHAM